MDQQRQTRAKRKARLLDDLQHDLEKEHDEELEPVQGAKTNRKAVKPTAPELEGDDFVSEFQAFVADMRRAEAEDGGSSNKAEAAAAGGGATGRTSRAGGGALVAGGDDDIDAILAAIGLDAKDDGKQQSQKASTPRRGKKGKR